MAREAALFDTTGGSVVEAFLLLRAEGANIPPSWIERAAESRKKREANTTLLKKNSLGAVQAAAGNWPTESASLDCVMRDGTGGKTKL